MSDVTDALAELKTILADVDPDPEDEPLHVWRYPADYELIDLEHLPVIIVAQVVNQPRNWGFATYGRGAHLWQAEILCFLEHGPLTDDRASAVAEMKHDPWPKAVADVLMQNLSLNGVARKIGDGESLFTYRIGHIHWWTGVYWGIRFVLPILNHPVQERGA